MAYDPTLAFRLRKLLAGEDGVDERPMLGGIAFLGNTNMAVAASRECAILVWIDSATTENEIARTLASALVVRGRAMNGSVRVDKEGVATTRALARYVRLRVA